MINKKTVEKLLAFTLAEVLVTMIVIALITVVSVPMIKKSKEYKESTKDKSYWVSMYDKNNRLVITTNVPAASAGIASDSTGEYAKFKPPAGVTRFNVTVVGGGGGGAAGEAGLGTTKTFFPDSNASSDSNNTSFTPVSDGLYQIIAIGGGGGGGGSAMMCGGTGGWSGGVTMATAKLHENKIYNVMAGPNGQGGLGKDFWGVMAPVWGPILIVSGVLVGGAGWVLGAALMAASGGGSALLGTAIATITTPDDYGDGGGRGIPSAFSGHGVEIAAGGGCGGQYNRKKGFWPRCKKTGGCEGFTPDFVGNTCRGAEVTCSNSGNLQGRPNGKSGGVVCTKSGSSYNCIHPGLAGALEGVDPTMFGNGGSAAGRTDDGNPGKPGMVQVRELPVFGGGGGQAGAVSFFSYDRSPLDRNSTDTFIRAYPGHGGAGETKNGGKGKDGTFSRFGTRIIADGGEGGRPRVTMANESTLKALGEDGAETTVPEYTLNNVAISGVKILRGGFFDASKINGQGFNQGSPVLQAMPGAGGGGGGAQGSQNFNSSEVVSGAGGNGAPGVVIVTW